MVQGKKCNINILILYLTILYVSFKDRNAYLRFSNGFDFLLNLEGAKNDSITRKVAVQSSVENYPNDWDSVWKRMLAIQRVSTARPFGNDKGSFSEIDSGCNNGRKTPNFDFSKHLHCSESVYNDIRVQCNRKETFYCCKPHKRLLEEFFESVKTQQFIDIERELFESINIDEDSDTFSCLEEQRQII